MAEQRALVMDQEDIKRRRRSMGGRAAGGLVDVVPEVIPNIFSFLAATDFATMAQSHRRLSDPAHRWRTSEMVRWEKEIGAFEAAIRVGDRLIAVVEYPAPALRYFAWDERQHPRHGIVLGAADPSPVGHVMIVSNDGKRDFRAVMDRVSTAIHRQMRAVHNGYGEGPSSPSRVVLLRSQQNNSVEQDLLTKTLPAYPIRLSTGYYLGDFVLDDNKVNALIELEDSTGAGHVAYTQVAGLLAEFSSNLWHNRHRWQRQLASADMFFTPADFSGPQDSVERHFPGNRSLVLDSPLGPQALREWSAAHPVYRL